MNVSTTIETVESNDGTCERHSRTRRWLEVQRPSDECWEWP